MYDVKQNLRQVLGDLPEGVRLVAISKYHPNEYIMAAYEEGQRIFGESHEQELRQKVESLPRDIEWHFIGHLQTNKVKYIAPYISMIEAVDSLKLLKEIDKQAARNNRVIKVLLELHIAEEETKYGLTLDACRQLLEGGEWRALQHVQICGLMMMGCHGCPLSSSMPFRHDAHGSCPSCPAATEVHRSSCRWSCTTGKAPHP